MKRLKLKFQTPQEIKEWRKAHGLQQTFFWPLLGVTQSAGSRYERERHIPVPTQILLTIVYGNEAESRAAVELLRATWQAADGGGLDQDTLARMISILHRNSSPELPQGEEAPTPRRGKKAAV